MILVGYTLAIFTYNRILEYDNWSNRDQQKTIDAARISSITTPSQIEPTYNDLPPEWRSDNPLQVVSSIDEDDSLIYFYNSKKTRDYFSSNSDSYDLILNQWYYYFKARGIKFVEIKDTDLSYRLKPGILILPSVLALNSSERNAIHSFEKNGGSVLATWATGTLDGKGKKTGYDFLHEQFNITVSGEISGNDSEKFLVLSGESPLGFDMPTGSRVWLGLDKVRELPLRFSGGNNVAGRFMDVVRTPIATGANEAIVFTELGSSRRVYLGFAETSWRFQQQNVYNLIDNIFLWLHRSPDAYLANWPYPYRAAQIVEMDTEQDFQNSINFSDLLDLNGLPGTFYCLTSVAKKFPDITRHLEQKHEIAFHGDMHDAFRGQPKETQSKRLDTMHQELQALVTNPSKLRGFRPPYELGDQIVESLLYEKKFSYILTNSDGTESMLPYLSSSSPKDFQTGLIVFPRTQRDDMNLIKDGFSTQNMAKAMIDDFDLAHEYGALGVLSVHSQNFKQDSPVAKATSQFLSYIKTSTNKTWVTTSGNIESWWRERALLKAKLTGDPKKLKLSVTIEKPGLFHSASIVISNPVKGLIPTIKPLNVEMTLPSIVALDDYRTAILFSALSPGVYNYYLNY